MAMILYGASLSPFVRKIRVALTYKRLEFQRVHIDPFNKPDDFKKISPLGRIPVLEDDGNIIADSAVIAAYIDKQHPHKPLYPSDAREYAETLWFEKFGDYELAPVATFTIFRQRLVMKLIGRETDEAAVQKALNSKLPSLLNYLETTLKGRDFLVGDQLTIADIAVATQWVNMALGEETLDANRWPSCHAHFERVKSLTCMGDLEAKELLAAQKIRENASA